MSICSAIIFVGKLALLMIPNIEVVTFFLIIFTLTFKLKEALLISTVYTIIEFLLWGLTEQAYIWTIIVLVTYIFKKLFYNHAVLWRVPYIGIYMVFIIYIMNRLFKNDFEFWALFSAFFGLTFGLMCTIPIYIITDKSFTIAYLINNIPFDVVHMVGNYTIMFLLGDLIFKTLQRLLNDYYLNGGKNENLY